mgnify:CR=1 FL=1
MCLHVAWLRVLVDNSLPYLLGFASVNACGNIYMTRASSPTSQMLYCSVYQMFELHILYMYPSKIYVYV